MTEKGIYIVKKLISTKEEDLKFTMEIFTSDFGRKEVKQKVKAFLKNKAFPDPDFEKYYNINKYLKDEDGSYLIEVKIDPAVKEKHTNYEMVLELDMLVSPGEAHTLSQFEKMRKFAYNDSQSIDDWYMKCKASDMMEFPGESQIHTLSPFENMHKSAYNGRESIDEWFMKCKPPFF